MKRIGIALFLIALAVAAAAQTPYGRITGTVTDAGGAVVPGATVRVINIDTNVTVADKTNAQGNYDASNLNPGMYRVEVEHAGFKLFKRGPIEVRVGDVLDISVALELGAITETVNVTAEAPLLENTNADLGQVIDHRRIEDLPLPGSAPMYLMQLAPGVISTNPPTHGWLPQAVDAISNMAAAGTRTRSSEFSLDGIPNMSQGGQLSFTPPPEMVQEFRVQTAPFDASVGHFTGAYVNMVIKGGTNAFHGSAVYTHLVPSWCAHDFFTNRFIYDLRTGPVTKEKIDTAWPAVMTNRYRVTASGPVRVPKLYNGRNRTFWTYGIDILDRNRPERGNPFTVPTPKERTGDFSELLAVGGNYQIYDPATIATAPNGRTRRDLFAGNIIPANRLDPMAKKILDYYPLPNATGTVDGRNNYSDAQPRRIDYHSNTVRVDHVINQNNRFYGSFTKSFLLEQWAQAFHNEARGYYRNRLHRGLALDDVMVLRPDWVLDLRFGVTRFVLYDRPVSLGFDLAKLGFPAALVSRLDGRLTAFPEVAIDGYATLGDVTSTSFVRWATAYYNSSATMSHMRGKHSLRFGSDFRVLRENSYDYGNISPHVDFSTGWTRGPMDNSGASPIGQGLASFLLGIPTGGWTDRNASYAEQSKYLALFIQDDWKVNRRLTVNAGIRWEAEFPTTERFNRSTRGFDFTAVNPIQAAARARYAASPIPELPVDQFRTPGGLLFTGVNGVPRQLWNTDWNNFAPRIGFAFALTPKRIIRAGYGVYPTSIGADRVDVFQQGFDQRTTIVPSLDNGLNFRARLADPFPDGLLEPAAASGGLTAWVGRNPSFFDPQRRPGYMQRWAFSLQQQFPQRVMLELAYVGNRGTNLGVSNELDAVPAQYLSRLPVRDQPVISQLTRAVANPFLGIPEFAGSGTEGLTVQAQRLLRPYPQYGGLTSTINGGFSWYHALNVRAERRFAGGYTLQASYTWSKFMEAIDKLNPTDLQPEHVISPQDRPHRIITSGIWELPFGRGRRFFRNRGGWLNLVVGGWSAQGIYQGQSGPPIGFANVIFFGNRHDFSGNLHEIVLPRDQRAVERWFNTDGFETRSGQVLTQNIRAFPSRLTGLRADGYNNFDLSMFKTFRLKERLSFQLRVEAQDALNHAMFAAPNAAPTNTAFGQVNSIVATEQRRVNLTGKFSW